MRAVLPVVALVLGLAVLLGACGDGGGADDATPTAATTEAPPTEGPPTEPPPTEPPATATPLPTEPTAAGAADPEFPPDAEPLNEDSVDFSLPPGGATELDSLTLLGEEAVPCAGLVAAISWQVTDPYPPEGIDLVVFGRRMGATIPVGEGPSGTATIGCMLLTFDNRSDRTVEVQLRYIAGSFGP